MIGSVDKEAENQLSARSRKAGIENATALEEAQRRGNVGGTPSGRGLCISDLSERGADQSFRNRLSASADQPRKAASNRPGRVLVSRHVQRLCHRQGRRGSP